MPLTDSERALIAKLREAEARATVGPWAHNRWRICSGVNSNSIKVVVDFAHNAVTRNQQSADDAEFTVAARNHMRELLDMVERLSGKAASRGIDKNAIPCDNPNP